MELNETKTLSIPYLTKGYSYEVFISLLLLRASIYLFIYITLSIIINLRYCY